MRTVCGVGLLMSFLACTGGGGGGGGTGGGSASTRKFAKFNVTNISGTYSGSSTSMRTATVTDYMDNCSATIIGGRSTSVQEISPNSSAGLMDLFFSESDVTIAPCSGRHVSSSGTDPCDSAGATTTAIPNFGIRTDIPTWDESAMIGLELLALPTGLPSCNYASFIGPITPKISGTTTLGNFTGSVPFDLRFTGTGMVQTNSNTSSNWTYDVTVTITPVR
jgi:hypothetical protein